MSGHALVFDVTEPRKGHGYLTEDIDGDEVNILGTLRDGTWFLYGGDQDQYQAEGSTVEIALRRFAALFGLTGTAEICREYRDETNVIDLGQAK